jgi:hypothetical protein
MAEKNSFANLLDSLASKKREKEQNAVADMGGDGVKGELPMADEQSISVTFIEWVWELDVATVRSVYDKATGEYTVDYTRHNIDAMTAEESKSFAEVLLSAARWRDTWQINAGAYLANNGRLQASPQDSQPIKEAENNEQLQTGLGSLRGTTETQGNPPAIVKE